MQKTKQRNIFSMVSKYPSNLNSNPEENQFTQILSYFLSKSEKFKKEFLKILFEKLKNKNLKLGNISKWSIYPQYYSSIEKEKAIFDILILNKHKKICFIIENKIASHPELKQLLKYKTILNSKQGEFKDEDYNIKEIFLFAYKSPKEINKEIKAKEKKPTKEDKIWIKKEYEAIKRLHYHFISWDEFSERLYARKKQIFSNDSLGNQFLKYIWRDKKMGKDFRGIEPFNEDNQYTDSKAKKIIERIMTHKAIKSELKKTYDEYNFEFRNNFSSGENIVWDVIRKKNSDHRNNPHFTMGLSKENKLNFQLTIPNGANHSWTKLKKLNKKSQLRKILNEIVINVPELWLRIVQRHTRGGQRLIIDGKCEMKCDVIPQIKSKEKNAAGFRKNVIWFESIITLLENKKNNINLQFDFDVPYYLDKDNKIRSYMERMNKLRGRKMPDDKEFPKEIANVLRAFKPLIEELMPKK